MLHSKKLLVFFLFLTAFAFGQRTYIDRFSNAAYNNNDGTHTFSGNWIEGRDDGTATAGAILIVPNRLRFRDLDDRFIYREVPLNGATSATVSFDYEAFNRGDETLRVFIWNVGANNFNEIATINTADANTITYTLTPAEIASNPRLLFFRGDGQWDDPERIFIDNVQFTATFVPTITIDDLSVDESAGTATFTARHTVENTTGPFTVNYTTVAGTATPGSDFTANTGVLNFNGNINDTETITVSITDDTDVENLVESFTVQFTSSSDGSVDISDTGTGSITDNDGLIISNGTTTTTCDATFLDPGGLGTNYPDNQDIVHTICPDSVDKDINITFPTFDLESGFDFLYVYDGPDTSGTLLGQFHNGNPPPANLRSLDATGCLTFRFTSDNIINGAGWEIAVSCVDQEPIIVVDDVTVNEDAGTAVFTVTHLRIATAPYSVTYETVDGTATAGEDYTAITGGTLNFDGTIGDTDTITVNITDDNRYELAPENFTVIFTASTEGTLDISDSATGTINDNEVVQNDVPLALYDDLHGSFEYAVAGGTLRTNDNATDACSITTTSFGNLTSTILPAGKTVEKAYLYWAHSNPDIDQDVSLEGSTVSADLIYGANFSGLQFYGYIADVTDVIAGIANPWAETYDFAGLTVDNGGGYCGNAVVLGAWSLMIFYEDVALPSSTINLYYGFDVIQNAGASYTLDNFFAISPTGSKATFLSYEGDATLDGNTGTNKEELSIQSESAATPTILTGDGGQTGINPFNSTIYDDFSGTNITTAYGLDLDTYDISTFLSTADTEVTANVDMGQDLVISSAVVLRVPSNLVSGTVFEDVNYPGGFGRNVTASSGVGVEGATIELYNALNLLRETTVTDANGDYNFGGMPDGNYSIRVVNPTVNSARGNGSSCGSCYGIQTFRAFYNGATLTEVVNEVGGADPSGEDAALGTLTGAQSVSTAVIASGGTGNLDFGFNFNTIVNTNEDGQGSLEQFIVNANQLDESYGILTMDIEANSIFDPVAGEDTSIFMIPPIGDTQGRNTDTGYTSGYFDIFISNGNPLSTVTGDNTKIDGRTQTAYSGNTNTGTVGSGGTDVGTSANALPNYDRPEIQVHRNGGDVLRLTGTDVVIRNVAVYANNNAGIRIDGGTATISNNLLGVNALGNNAGNIDFGVEITDGTVLIDGNYIATNTDYGVYVNGGTSTILQNNHIASNGDSPCEDNIRINNGSGVVIQRNLIENAAALGIEGNGISGGVTIAENTIRNSGQNGGACSGDIENAGIRLDGSNSSITNNVIHQNGGAGLVLAGGNTSGNLISQNSFYANGTTADALGIDLDQSNGLGDGITLNDNGDGDNGPNGAINFPIVTSSTVSGTTLTVRGWSRPGASIEFFLTDVNEGTAAVGDNQLGLSTDYGEGQTYLGTAVEGSGADLDSSSSLYTDLDGNTDNTDRFHFIITLPPSTVAGEFLTSTATISNTTSEFSPFSILKIPTVITNRKITYRVKKD